MQWNKNLRFATCILSVVMILSLPPGCKKSDGPVPAMAIPDSVTDIDGNVYHPVKIGIQVWLIENLRTTHYRNGDPIPEVPATSRWGRSDSGACCNYNNMMQNSLIYGKLYNWPAVHDQRNLCPAGWHVPDENEWATLVSFAGGETTAGGRLKEFGFSHWLAPNTAATNETGFTALPAGYRNDTGVFANMNRSAIFWSTTSYDPSHAWYHYTYYDYQVMFKDFYHNKAHGFSVRCIINE